jgi:hypothetical protein
MLNKKNIVFFFLILSLFGISLFPNFVHAKGLPPIPVLMIGIGNDNIVKDQANDLYSIDDDQFIPSSTQIPSIDLKNITVDENGPNFTIAIGFYGDYNESSDSRIEIYFNINSSSSNQEDANLHIYLRQSTSRVRCEGIREYIQYGIHAINGEIVEWTFPKLNVTDIVPNNKTISEWKVLVMSDVDISFNNYFYDFLGEDIVNISAYPLFLIGLASIISIALVVKKAEYLK